jgi:hypothetical protein
VEGFPPPFMPFCELDERERCIEAAAAAAAAEARAICSLTKASMEFEGV